MFIPNRADSNARLARHEAKRDTTAADLKANAAALEAALKFYHPHTVRILIKPSGEVIGYEEGDVNASYSLSITAAALRLEDHAKAVQESRTDRRDPDRADIMPKIGRRQSDRRGVPIIDPLTGNTAVSMNGKTYR